MSNSKSNDEKSIHTSSQHEKNTKKNILIREIMKLVDEKTNPFKLQILTDYVKKISESSTVYIENEVDLSSVVDVARRSVMSLKKGEKEKFNVYVQIFNNFFDNEINRRYTNNISKMFEDDVSDDEEDNDEYSSSDDDDVSDDDDKEFMNSIIEMDDFGEKVEDSIDEIENGNNEDDVENDLD